MGEGCWGFFVIEGEVNLPFFPVGTVLPRYFFSSSVDSVRDVGSF